MELYNADTGKLLCAHYPDYGKTNQVVQFILKYEVDICWEVHTNWKTMTFFSLKMPSWHWSNFFTFQVFDELGYIAIPPCIWGSEEVLPNYKEGVT